MTWKWGGESHQGHCSGLVMQNLQDKHNPSRAGACKQNWITQYHKGGCTHTHLSCQYYGHCNNYTISELINPVCDSLLHIKGHHCLRVQITDFMFLHVGTSYIPTIQNRSEDTDTHIIKTNLYNAVWKRYSMSWVVKHCPTFTLTVMGTTNCN